MKKDAFSGALRRELNRRPALPAQIVLFVLSVAVFMAFALHARYAMIDEFAASNVQSLTTLTARIYTAIFALSLAVQLRMARRLPLCAQMLAALVTGAVLLGKISLLDYVSDDYAIFLSNWIYDYSSMSLLQGLGTYIGSDYSPPYLYFMLLISRIRDFPWQYMVKAITIAFEVLLGLSLSALAGLRIKGDGARLAIFHIATLLPTVVFNGAYWGQCDVIYASFCLAALYMGLTKRSAACMALLGIALSFKLQTAFFLPMLLPLWLRKDIKLRHLPLIPAAYMGMMVPALIGGKSLHHVLTVYMTQAGTYNMMTVNAQSLWQMLPPLDSDALYGMFSGLALILGMAAMLAACTLIVMHRERISQSAVMLFTLLILSGVPFFLPKMHERYTFGADVLSFALAAQKPRPYAILPLLFGLSSYICYTEGLPGDAIMPLKWASVLQLTAIALTTAALFRSVATVDARAMEVKA